MKLTLQSFLRWAIAVGLAFACTVVAMAQVQYTLGAIDHGAYDECGFHDRSDPEYVTGLRGLQHRSFFVFDRTVLPAGFERAELRLFLPIGGYESPQKNENLIIYMVNSIPVDRLVAGGTDLRSVYSDLGGGTNFGSTRISKAEEGQYVSVPLNEAFESFLAGVTGVFALGARVSTVSGNAAQNLFSLAEGSSLPGDAVQLVAYADGRVDAPATAVVPEPGTYSLLAAMALVAAVGGRTLRRNRALGRTRASGCARRYRAEARPKPWSRRLARSAVC